MLMKIQKNNFLKSVKLLLDSKSIKEELKSVNDFIYHFENFFSDVILKVNNEKQTSGGIALSSQHAKDCLKDPIRTVRFLKGIYKAIITLDKKFVNEKTTILYAGCGPLGTLILPLLGFFSSEKIEIILLDINKSSIESVKKIVKKLNYEAFIKEYVIADATKYKKPNDCSLHMIVTETMDKALTKEPQVEITRNLSKQLVKKGIFIPEKIEIKRGYTFFAKEYVFDLKKDILDLELEKKESSKEKLFTVTGKVNSKDYFNFETNWISKPSNFDRKPDICLFTEVIIFEDIKLKKSESFITNPYCVKSLYTLKKEKYKLQYSTKEMPNWRILEQ